MNKILCFYDHQKGSMLFLFFLMGWHLFLLMPHVARACGGSDDAPAIPADGECDTDYYGLEGRVDYAKAFECFQNAKAYEMLILMHLNGEGVPSDVEKADALLAAEEKNIHQGYMKVLREAIDNRKKSPKELHRPLHFCEDLSGHYKGSFLCYEPHTYCLELDNLLVAAKLETLQTRIKAGISSTEGDLLMELITAFDAFREAEIERVVLSETTFGMETPSHLGVLENDKWVLSKKIQNDFLKLLKEAVAQRKLETGDEQAYAAADRRLNQAYRDHLRAYMESQDIERDHKTKAEYKKHVKKTQLAWIKYRDLWAKLAGVLYKTQTRIHHPETSIKTVLTTIRIDELKE